MQGLLLNFLLQRKFPDPPGVVNDVRHCIQELTLTFYVNEQSPYVPRETSDLGFFPYSVLSRCHHLGYVYLFAVPSANQT